MADDATPPGDAAFLVTVDWEKQFEEMISVRYQLLGHSAETVFFADKVDGNQDETALVAALEPILDALRAVGQPQATYRDKAFAEAPKLYRVVISETGAEAQALSTLALWDDPQSPIKELIGDPVVLALLPAVIAAAHKLVETRLAR